MGMLETLSRSICHEFNNALGGIQGYAQLALRNPDDEQLVARAMDVAIRAGKRMSEVTNRLGIFANYREEMPFAVDSLNTLIEDCLELLHPAFEECGIDLQAELAPGISIRCHAAHLRLALMEILSNAAEAVGNPENDTPQVQLHLALSDENQAVLTISDNGHGIDPEAADRIFDPFFSTRDIMGGGNDKRTRGLGLAVAAGVIREHKGTLSLLESKATIGTCLEVRLPMISHDKEGAHTVMVIDDEAPIRNIFDKFLNMAGYNVIPCANAKEGLEALAENASIDIILLDQMMPGMSGLEFLEALQERQLAIPTIMITSAYSPEIARAALERGAIGVEAKPINRQRMVFLLDCRLRQGQVRLPLAAEPHGGGGAEQILLMDPDALTREVIHCALSQSGYRVTTCADTPHAIAATEREYFNLILIDPFHPEGQHTSLIQQLQRNNPYTPILVLSSPATRGAGRKAVDAGALRSIDKPIEVMTLMAEVERVVKLFKQPLK
jgi:CheY-like chemotaxis protein